MKQKADQAPPFPPGAVVRFTYPDGSVFNLDAAEINATIQRQRDAYRKIRAEARRKYGALGGRPPTPGRPSAQDIVLRLGERWLRPRERYSSARAWLVRELAAEFQVDERTSRGWVREALDGVRSTKSRNAGEM